MTRLFSSPPIPLVQPNPPPTSSPSSISSPLSSRTTKPCSSRSSSISVEGWSRRLPGTRPSRCRSTLFPLKVKVTSSNSSSSSILFRCVVPVGKVALLWSWFRSLCFLRTFSLSLARLPSLSRCHLGLHSSLCLFVFLLALVSLVQHHHPVPFLFIIASRRRLPSPFFYDSFCRGPTLFCTHDFSPLFHDNFSNSSPDPEQERAATWAKRKKRKTMDASRSEVCRKTFPFLFHCLFLLLLNVDIWIQTPLLASSGRCRSKRRNRRERERQILDANSRPPSRVSWPHIGKTKGYVAR